MPINTSLKIALCLGLKIAGMVVHGATVCNKWSCVSQSKRVLVGP